MQIVVFDDRNSLAHVILGILTTLWLGFFIIFVFYELIEFCYKYARKEETPAHFIGDLAEYFIGYSLIKLLQQVITN